MKLPIAQTLEVFVNHLDLDGLKILHLSGNHDIFYGLEELTKELTNFIFMDNYSTTFDFKKNNIQIVGLADRFSKFFKVQRDEETAIYVNKGLGTWGIDFRYKANNEITILKLVSKSKDNL